MFKTPNLPLKLKLPLIMVALTATFLVTVSFLVFSIAEKNIRQNVFAAQAIEAKAGAQALSFLIDAARTDVSNQAASPTVFRAINNFGRVVGMIEDDDPIGYMKRHYVAENPNAAGEREKLADPGDGSYYTQSHATYHPTFLRMLQQNGYGDIYLFDTQGLLSYSVKKHADFAENFASGPLAETGLGQVFNAALLLEAGQVAVADYGIYEPAGGQAAAFMAAPVFNKKKEAIGVIAVQLGGEGVLAALTGNLEPGRDQNIYLVSEDGLARSPSVIEGLFSVLDPLPEAAHITAARNREGGRFESVTAASGAEAIAMVMPLDLAGFSWSLVMEQDAATAFATVQDIRLAAMMMIGAAVVIAIIVSLIAARSVTRPVNALCEATNALVEEDYETEIAGKARGDELGELARSLDTFRGKLQEADAAAAREEAAARQTAAVVEEMSGALAELQRGNLACEISQPFAEHYEALRQNFNESLANLRGSMGEVVAAAQNVDRFSQEQHASAGEMAHRTESQASTLEETATALKDLTQGIRLTAERAMKVDDTMRGTRGEAERSNEVVTAAVSAMDEIQQASSEISKIINMIDDIAFQTNLLALNAGVEAARAGQAGAGFAVVASEVRALAQRASQAAGQIKELTTASESHVENGVAMVGRAGDALTSIIEQVTDVSGLVTEIADGVQEQSKGLENINSAMHQLDNVTQQNTAMAEEASAASQLLQGEARSLSGTVGRFQLEGGLPLPAGDGQGGWDADPFDAPQALRA